MGNRGAYAQRTYDSDGKVMATYDTRTCAAQVPAELAEEPYSDDDGDEVKEEKESRTSKNKSSKKDKRSMRDSAHDSKV